MQAIEPARPRPVMPERRFHISQGTTFTGSLPYFGLLLILAGGVTMGFGGSEELPVLLVAGAPLVLLGILLFLNIRGVTIDPRQHRVRIYQHLLFVKVGAWIPIERFDHVVITRHRERFSHAIGSMMLGTQANVRSYFVYLRGPQLSLEVNEYMKKPQATTTAERVAQATGLPVQDKALPQPRRTTRR
jgi:hypothetical protein